MFRLRIFIFCRLHRVESSENRKVKRGNSTWFAGFLNCYDHLSYIGTFTVMMIRAACWFGFTLLIRFDAHVQDPLAGMQFTTGTYYRLASDIKRLAHDLCGGRCIFFLEGGYDLKSLSNSVADSFRAFLGDKSLSSRLDNPAFLYDEPSVYARQAIDTIRSIHSL